MSQLNFATELVIWTEEQWDCVHFSDESKFNLFGCDERRFFWRSPKERYSPQCTKGSVKFGGRDVMVFGTISPAGAGLLVRIHSKINATEYKDILKEHVPNMRTTINQPAVFVQNNAPCYTAKSVKTVYSWEDATVIEWPFQSPDMNTVDYVWKLRNERVEEKNPINVEEIWTNLKGEWEKISVNECKTLIRSCSKRCQGVI